MAYLTFRNIQTLKNILNILRLLFLLLTIRVTKSYVTKGEGIVVVVIIRELDLELLHYVGMRSNVNNVGIFIIGK
jgi:hypothetical protein